MISSWIDRFLLGGYERAKREALLEVVGRFARGNTAVQDGRVLDDADIGYLRKRGSKALQNLRRLT